MLSMGALIASSSFVCLVEVRLRLGIVEDVSELRWQRVAQDSGRRLCENERNRKVGWKVIELNLQ